MTPRTNILQDILSKFERSEKFWKYIVLYIQFGGQIIFRREELNYIFDFVISSYNPITRET